MHYAIRVRETDNYLPAHRPGHLGGGFSWDEPRPQGGRWGPRLFPTRQGAMNALYAWLQGHWDTDEGGDIRSPIHVDGRLLSNMELVGFELVETQILRKG